MYVHILIKKIFKALFVHFTAHSKKKRFIPEMYVRNSAFSEYFFFILQLIVFCFRFLTLSPDGDVFVRSTFYLYFN